MFIERNSYWQVLLYSLAGMAVVFLLAYFFYRSWMAVPFLIPIGAYVTFYLDEEKQKKESEVLKKQFREMILAVATNLKAGYSIENSFTEARADMIRLYGNNGQIVRELWNIENALKVNQTLEQQLYRFANKCRIEEVMDFAEIFSIAKRMGGNLAEIINNTAEIIAAKIEVDDEIRVMTRESRLEQELMTVVPFLIILYINLTNKGFFDVLYHNPAGIILMTLCLGGYVGSVVIAEKIMRIQV